MKEIVNKLNELYGEISNSKKLNDDDKNSILDMLSEVEYFIESIGE